MLRRRREMPGGKDVRERRPGSPRPLLVERRNFGREDDSIGADFGFQHLTHQAFAVSVTVRQCGIEERDPAVDSLAQCLACLAVLDATPHVGAEPPAAKPEFADGVARRAEDPSLQCHYQPAYCARMSEYAVEPRLRPCQP